MVTLNWATMLWRTKVWSRSLPQKNDWSSQEYLSFVLPHPSTSVTGYPNTGRNEMTSHPGLWSNPAEHFLSQTNRLYHVSFTLLNIFTEYIQYAQDIYSVFAILQGLLENLKGNDNLFEEGRATIWKRKWDHVMSKRKWAGEGNVMLWQQENECVWWKGRQGCADPISDQFIQQPSALCVYLTSDKTDSQ